MRLAGHLYDSFTSPAIIEEVQEVLARPEFGGYRSSINSWLDDFVRASRQMFPEDITQGGARIVHGDTTDLPILHTAFAVNAAGAEFAAILEAAQDDGGWFLVSENTRDLSPGWNVYGWQFTTAAGLLARLLRRE